MNIAQGGERAAGCAVPVKRRPRLRTMGKTVRDEERFGEQRRHARRAEARNEHSAKRHLEQRRAQRIGELRITANAQMPVSVWKGTLLPMPMPSVERDIVREFGAVYGPYTGTSFASTTETDIEHIVAASEAHDSGLCAADAATKARFARDLRNLTLASPEVNRFEKSGKDASEWLPARNQCWFAGRIVEVRSAYGLTIDRREAAALERVLDGCDSRLRPAWFSPRCAAPPCGRSGRRDRSTLGLPVDAHAWSCGRRPTARAPRPLPYLRSRCRVR